MTRQLKAWFFDFGFSRLFSFGSFRHYARLVSAKIQITNVYPRWISIFKIL
ncbi:hypothetical protein JCM19301_3559 [Jejuia pallidilutea]|uniref:Uncharacterized protein n=1 Tax=Jejuia pallidilutea TaxID=504487 RepID=A0A090VRE2_9FLAO|nr:hypothetical protein JCM19301_3559 [Jejuia pallidilutea]GAL71508.1 hypothetical protein JCM19302_1677 [Jejuia pallidilutea]GAL88489.1 hypothetical protein JCM19538_3002 [Jejuia pallidilutea]